MPIYTVLLDTRARREVERLPGHVRERFFHLFEMLADDPYRPRPGCDIRALEGARGALAVRVGSYRGLFEVHGTEVQFTRFGHRRHVYRR